MISDQVKSSRDDIINKNLGRGSKAVTPWDEILLGYMESVQIQRMDEKGRRLGQPFFKIKEDNEIYNSSRVGKWMEQINDLLKSTNSEVQESKKILESLTNEISAINGPIQSKLVEQIKEIRSARMATVNEIREILSSLKEIRKFFLDSDYSQEVERLERFVSVCKELKRLKEDGTLDAVSDVSIRMAIKEELH